MTNNKNIKLEPSFTIICDDIRKEDNGKHILIGVYTGNINLAGPKPTDDMRVAANLHLHFWIACKVEEKIGIAPFEIKIDEPTKKGAIIINGQVTIDNPPKPNEIIPIVVGPIPLRIWESGNLVVSLKLHGEKEFTALCTMPVNFHLAK